MTKILVYGTLRQGFGAHGALKGAKFVKNVRVPGYDMVNCGGFPGIYPNPENQEGIEGELYEDVDAATLEHLDHYEGYREANPDRSHYLRKEIEVAGDKVFIYELNPKQANRAWYQAVPSGDWKNRGEERCNP